MRAKEKELTPCDSSHTGQMDSYSFRSSMSDSRRLKVNHITQGHPGNEQGNFDSNLGLTPDLCMRKTSILKR